MHLEESLPELGVDSYMSTGEHDAFNDHRRKIEISGESVENFLEDHYGAVSERP